MCVRPTHITYYKRINPRVNAGLTLLLYVCVAHTHEPNPFSFYILCQVGIFKIIRIIMEGLLFTPSLVVFALLQVTMWLLLLSQHKS